MTGHLAAVAEEWERNGRRRRALETVAPTVHWSTYLNWCRCAADRSGAAWERQLDVRVPPPPVVVPADVRASACTLRLLVPGMSYDAARERLIAQFGEEKGGISDASLKRIWEEGGLARPRGRQRAPQEDVVRLSGGAGLAFLLQTGLCDRTRGGQTDRAGAAKLIAPGAAKLIAPG